MGKDAGVIHVNMSAWEFFMLWFGKALHYACHVAWPLYLHYDTDGYGFLWEYLVCNCVVGTILSTTFIVSHNTLETKEPCYRNRDDWGKWQIETSCSHGGLLEQTFTGGLNFQI